MLIIIGDSINDSFFFKQNTDEEKQFNMNIAEGIVKKKPKLNISKAVNKQIYEEQSQ